MFSSTKQRSPVVLYIVYVQNMYVYMVQNTTAQPTVEKAFTSAPSLTKFSITETCPCLTAICKGAHLFWKI